MAVEMGIVMKVWMAKKVGMITTATNKRAGGGRCLAQESLPGVSQRDVPGLG